MSIKNSIPAIYRANTLSLMAWIWIESALYCQAPDGALSIADAARQFQEFFGLEEDDMDIYHIRMCYYRMQEANRERSETPFRFPAGQDGDLLHALKTIKEFFDQSTK